MLGQLARAAIYRPSAGFDATLILPQQRVSRRHRILSAHANNYHRLVQWPAQQFNCVHPNYIQVLTLPMQLGMMSKSPFPFKAFGLVHIANKIDVIKLPDLQSELSLNAYFGDIYAHKRGIVFALHSEAAIDGEAVVKATSYYLARTKQTGSGVFKPFSELTMSSLPLQDKDAGQQTQASKPVAIRELIFEENCGRQYAKVSGDYNPIHLWPATSKMFGFDQAIAHGMYSHALAISLMAKNNQYTVDKKQSVKANFKQPILLPSRANLCTQNSGNTVSFSLSGDSQGRRNNKRNEYLSGTVTPL
jgi:hypothetical protein